MGDVGFQQWADAGCYGGLACSLIASACLATYALLRRRGTPRQLARATLVCLAASCLMLVPVWWNLNRLDVYGPTLGQGEIIFWLAWIAFVGWYVPLGTLAGYATLAASQQAPTHGARAQSSASTIEEALNDPARRIEPLGAGQAWAHLVPIESTPLRHPLALTRQVTIMGREVDNDIMLDDTRASRHHVEIRWDHGRVQLRDLGSMNGTFVNQQAVRGPVLLKSGDVIEVGAQRFRFEQLVAERRRVSGPVLPEETRKMAGTGRPPGQSGPRPLPLPALKLLALNGRAVGMEWTIHGAILTLGREQDCDIYLPDNSVSRQHAQIVRQPGGYFVSDLQSSNGTSLNDAPLNAPALLRPGDLLRLGEMVLRCEAVSPASQTTQAIRPQNGAVPPGVAAPHAQAADGTTISGN
jgi:pSer/pThr/pTyr-binding forkhead associated (FHA) protein